MITAGSFITVLVIAKRQPLTCNLSSACDRFLQRALAIGKGQVYILHLSAVRRQQRELVRVLSLRELSLPLLYLQWASGAPAQEQTGCVLVLPAAAEEHLHYAKLTETPSQLRSLNQWVLDSSQHQRMSLTHLCLASFRLETRPTRMVRTQRQSRRRERTSRR